ncbi:MAG TPA: DHA2 family efflux MFS transporter permease subunit [Candidatus Lumbricidophila sp.]|nr:DHA2 family efflux MFS transporter permease subunit [Candidatus Lumbricidophila sp.]
MNEQHTKPRNPWPALWAMIIGFFMILVDSTIVSIANPTILEKLHTDITSVLWATSAYLLAYAVPLLITGRLGDRFGPRTMYLTGLAVFTLASLWCGLSQDIGTLILARTVQGLGAGMLTPQTMAVITRTFPPSQRGAALGLWGATAGVATLVGPIAGGLLVDSLGWEWIFFVNVPVGVIGFVLAWMLVPKLETHSHRFDWLGVLLSGAGLFLIVFGIQEGESYDWGTITGPITVWGLIIVGLVVFTEFIVWQWFNKREPLVPLRLFADRNFSLGNLAISATGAAIVALPLPLVFYYQVARGMTPTQGALMFIPMAIVTGIASPIVGRLSDRMNPKWLTVAGGAIIVVALYLALMLMTPDAPIWQLLIPSGLLGLGMAGIWVPVGSTVTRNLPLADAGAGSGVYNTTRQMGSVLGSAAITALLNARLAAELPGFNAEQAEAAAKATGSIPPAVIEGFSRAMSQAMWLPLIGFGITGLVALFFAKPKVTVDWSASANAKAKVKPRQAGQATAPAPDAPAASAEPVLADESAP